MKFTAKLAQRQKVSLKIGIQGPSGSGKTLSALFLAKGLCGGDMSKVAVIDTENKSALYYADRDGLTGWNHIEFEAPYSPQNYVDAITYAESLGYQCCIIDSISHEWDGRGGALDIQQEKIASGKGINSYTAWAKVTPIHNAFMDRIRDSSMHMIVTIRSKQDYVLEENDRGKQVPKKVGMKGIQREGFDYEFGVMFDVNMSHYAESSKDRTGIFMGKDAFIISEKTGEEFIRWANSGVIESELYEEKDKQKILLRDEAASILVTDKELLKKISQYCIGKPVKDLRMLIGEYLVTAEPTTVTAGESK